MPNASHLAAFAASTLLLVSSAADAATATTSFQVTASVASSCNVAASNLAFGSYDPLTVTPTTANGNVQVTCTLGTTYTVGLNAGTGSGSTVTARKMTSGTDTLGYSLYRDVAHTQNWGNTAGTDTAAGVGTGLAINHTVYGLIPAQQSIPNGSYVDTITVTVTY